MVFRHAYAVGYGGCLILLVVKPHLLDNGFHERARIALVVDGKVAAVANLVCLTAQDVGEHRVECSHIEPACLVQPHDFAYAVLHLGCSLVGKGQCQDVPWGKPRLHQICNLVCQHTGFSRAGTRNHQLRTVAVGHRLALAVVKLAEQRLIFTILH